MPNDDYYRNQIAVELERIADILLRNNIVQDTGPIYSAARDCRASGPNNCWSYRIDRLIIHNLGDIKMIPSETQEISLELTISVVGYCEPEENGDPLSELALEINISGEILTESEDECIIKHVNCAWHLDRHIHQDGDGVPEFNHPHYHFQFGGNKMEYIANMGGGPLTFGAALFLDSPRIAHPPLEAILGIDFILTNFIGFGELSFREEGNYRNIIKSKQRQIWKPYVHSLYQVWENVRDDYPWQPTTIWPQLFPERY